MARLNSNLCASTHGEHERDDAWSNFESSHKIQSRGFKKIQTFCYFLGKGADPKSAVGTAFSFSRPKRQASAIANISRVLQFASKRFVNSFLNL
jgi:hypothetical protein